MKFPSLLYSGAPSGSVISPDVFNDLKLDLLLGEEAIKAMLRLCPAEDIPVRQQLFSELENAELRTHFKLLARDIASVCKLSEALDGAACDNERNYIFFNLICIKRSNKLKCIFFSSICCSCFFNSSYASC